MMKISTLTATTAVTAAEAAAKKLLSTPMMKMMFTTNYLPVDRVVDLDDVIERVGHAFEQHHDSTLLRPFVIPSDAKINMLKELKLAVHTFGLSPKQLKELVITGYKRSFYHGPYTERREYVRKVMDWYDEVATQFSVPLK